MKTIFILILINVFSLSKAFSQATVPAAQTLPYSQDFSALAVSSTTYPPGWQGWQLNSTTGSSSSFRTTPALNNVSLTGSATAATTATGVLNANMKLGILASGTGDPALGLAVNTTGKVNLMVTFDISTLRNAYNGSAETRRNNVELQYRVAGTIGDFISLTGSIYRNNTTVQTSGTNTQNAKRFQFVLPVACENQAVVQLRWVQRDSAGTGTRPSFSIDNVIVCPAPIVSATVKSACGGNNGAITLNVSAGLPPYSFVWDITNLNGPVFVVTAVSKTSHPNPSAFPVVYAIDGIQGKVLDLTRGIDYTFSGTFPGHPFHITTSTTGGTGVGTGMVQSGTTNNLLIDGALVFTPNASHPTLLYYQCNAHSQMGWKININSGSLTTQNISNIAPGKYSAAISSSDGSITMITVTVPTGTAPVANASSNSPVCEGSPLLLTATGGVTYSWSGPVSFTSTQQNPVRNFVALNEAGQYTVTATASNGCTSADIENVVVNIRPAAGLISPDSGPEGTVVQISGTNLSNSNQVLIGTSSAVPQVNSNSALQFSVPVGAASNNVVVINSNGCKDTTDQIFTVLNIHLDLKCFIQGLYDAASHTMYAAAISSADTITVELYSIADLGQPVYTSRQIIDVNGNGNFYFPQSVNGGTYYIVVKHRNSIETWSKDAQLFSTLTNYDFTN